MTSGTHERVLARLAVIEGVARGAHLPFRDRWRTGRKVGRTVYAETRPADEGVLIGVMDTPALAALVATFDPATVFDLVDWLQRAVSRHEPMRIVVDEDEVGWYASERGELLCPECREEPDCGFVVSLAEALGVGDE